MTHEELRDSYELYVLGAADAAEDNEIRGHLARGCEICTAQVKRARWMAAALGQLAEPAAPPARLRRRILASTGYEQRRFGLAPFLGAALLMALFGTFYFSGRVRDYATLATRLDGELRGATIELTRLREALAIINGAETKVLTIGPEPQCKVFVNPEQGVLLLAANLAQPPAGKAYEMWVLRRNKKAPLRAGTFRPDSNGSAMHIQRGAVNGNDVAAVAVTLESEGGSATPTPPLLIVAPFAP